MTKLYIGVDLHKRSSTWVGIDADRNEVMNVTCPVRFADIERLVARLPAPPEETELALEPVCGWRWISELGKAKGITIHPANPKGLGEIAGSHKKTDTNDARSLANLLRAGYLPPAYDAPEEVHRLRRAVRHRSFLVSRATRAKCRIQAICTAEGAHRTTEKPMTNTGREMIEHTGDRYPEISDLYALIDDGAPYTARAESEIVERLAATPELQQVADIIRTMPGIGPVTAAAIVSEVGDFTRFPSPKHLASYAGLNPIVRASGEKHSVFRLSKRGSRILRAALIDSACRVRDKEASRHLYAYYERMVSVHAKSRLEARVALAHKMLTCLWYMATRGVEYDDQALQSAQSGVTSKFLPGA